MQSSAARMQLSLAQTLRNASPRPSPPLKAFLPSFDAFLRPGTLLQLRVATVSDLLIDHRELI